MGLLSKLSAGLKKTRDAFAGGLLRALRGRRLDEDLLEEITDILIEGDVGVKTSDVLGEQLRFGLARLRSHEECVYHRILKEVYPDDQFVFDNVARWSERPPKADGPR